MEIWSQPWERPTTTVPCQNGRTEQAYYLRILPGGGRPGVRLKVVVTYTAAVEVTSFDATPADPKAGWRRSTLTTRRLRPARACSSTASARSARPPSQMRLSARHRRERHRLGETPLGETSPGLADVIVELRTVPWRRRRSSARAAGLR